MVEKKKLVVYDFDGTLVDTPLPEDGKVLYESKTGKKWPHVGWWGKEDSLNGDIFEIKPIQMVIDSYNKEKLDSESLTLMLTGRMNKLKYSIKKILDKLDLKFDLYHYNYGDSTDVCKLKTLDRILLENKSIDKIEMYEDRESHVIIFKKWGDELVESGRISDFKIITVPSNRH